MVSQARRDNGRFGKSMQRDLGANGLRKVGEKAGCVPSPGCTPRSVLFMRGSSRIAGAPAQELALSLWCWRWAAESVWRGRNREQGGKAGECWPRH